MVITACLVEPPAFTGLDIRIAPSDAVDVV
jgi:hypothetical protein